MPAVFRRLSEMWADILPGLPDPVQVRFGSRSFLITEPIGESGRPRIDNLIGSANLRSMTTIVKKKTEVVVPRSIRRQAGIKDGDHLEFKASSRRITITALEPAYRPTKAEAAAIRKGEAEIKRGDFVTLKDLLHDLDHRRRKGGAKAAPKNSR